MNQPKKAFNEVRAILGKLDRSREELRQKPPASENTRPATAVPAPQPAPAPAAMPRPGIPVQTAPARPAPAPTPGSKYGRAQPIRPSTSEPLGRWNPPGQ